MLHALLLLELLPLQLHLLRLDVVELLLQGQGLLRVRALFRHVRNGPHMSHLGPWWSKRRARALGSNHADAVVVCNNGGVGGVMLCVWINDVI